MFGLSPEIAALLALAITIGGIVKGITGIGLPIVTMAIALNFLPAHTVLAVLCIPIIVTNLWQTARMGAFMEPLRRFWLMILVFMAALAASAQLVTGFSPETLFGLLGTTVVLFTLSQFFRPPTKPLSPLGEKIGGLTASLAGGFLGGLTTIWGPPMVMYFLMLKLDKDTFVRAVGLIWFIGAIPLSLAYWQNGLLNEKTLPISVAICLPGVLGTWIGERIRARINQEVFRKALLVMLFIIGCNLIRRAFF